MRTEHYDEACRLLLKRESLIAAKKIYIDDSTRFTIDTDGQSCHSFRLNAKDSARVAQAIKNTLEELIKDVDNQLEEI